VKVNALFYFIVVDSSKAELQVEQYYAATSQLAQTTLRSVLGQHELDDMLTERDALNKDVQQILDKHSDGWGIKVSNVEIKHVDLDESMIRAIARQAEAERSRRAKVIHAEGEQQAAKKLSEAATELQGAPQAMQLRYLQTLLDVSTSTSGQNNTIIFPLPMDLIKPLLEKTEPKS
ncbi:slipin family protein, partial [bacterium]|nr:slipin family protein [bacterium]